MAHPLLEVDLVAALERELGLAGKRTADVPGLAGFRLKFRWRFYRLADAGFFLTIFNFLCATAAGNPAWWLSAFVGLPLAGAMMLLGEMGARLITRQLNRPAALQMVMDLNGAFYE